MIRNLDWLCNHPTKKFIADSHFPGLVSVLKWRSECKISGPDVSDTVEWKWECYCYLEMDVEKYFRVQRWLEFWRSQVEGFRTFSILLVLSQDGVIYRNIQLEAYNGDGFLAILEGLIHVMNSYPAFQRIIVLDHCIIHHVLRVKEYGCLALVRLRSQHRWALMS